MLRIVRVSGNLLVAGLRLQSLWSPWTTGDRRTRCNGPPTTKQPTESEREDISQTKTLGYSCRDLPGYKGSSRFGGTYAPQITFNFQSFPSQRSNWQVLLIGFSLPPPVHSFDSKFALNLLSYSFRYTLPGPWNTPCRFPAVSKCRTELFSHSLY